MYVSVCRCVDVVVCVMAWLASICVMFAPENGHGPKSQPAQAASWGAQANDNNRQAKHKQQQQQEEWGSRDGRREERGFGARAEPLALLADAMLLITPMCA